MKKVNCLNCGKEFEVSNDYWKPYFCDSPCWEKYMEHTYTCKCCNEIWEFCPDDYEYDENLYPTICPLCNMSIMGMLEELRDENIFVKLKYIYKRIIYKLIK